ncbi:ribonuclease P protein component [Maribacter sp. 2-571]|uniref:ribonuclease P protein component n=1 Tax=Maribacter sp. 2-571 TaxID=3417569 RepID=UPI003D339467
MSKPALGFSKNEKLKSRKSIERLFVEGNSVSKYPIKLMYIAADPDQQAPIVAGVTVPKRNFKSAVKRNRIKRLLREGYRLNKALVFNNTERRFAFLFLYLGKEEPTFERISEAMKKVLTRFIDEAERR